MIQTTAGSTSRSDELFGPIETPLTRTTQTVHECNPRESKPLSFRTHESQTHSSKGSTILSFFCQGQDKRISAWPWSPFRGGTLVTRYFRSLIWRYGVGHNRSTFACRPSMCSRVGEGCRMSCTSRASDGCIGGNCCRWWAGRTSCICTRDIVVCDRHKPRAR